MSSRVFLFVCVLAALLTITSCTRSAPSNTPAPASPTPAAKKFSTADLAKLRWIEGSWRGTGEANNKPAGQRVYRMERWPPTKP